MKSVLCILTSLCVVALAFWAYRENYATQVVLKDTGKLHSEIREAHSRLAVLRAEWAYLNRPDRLQELADLNFDKLQLLPLRPDQFGRVDQVSFPPDPALVINGPIDVSSQTSEEAQP